MRLGNECVQVKAGSLMDKTVGQHMQALEQKLNVLNAGIMDENDRAKRNQLESELRAVESALTLYRSALQAEERQAISDALHGLTVLRSELETRSQDTGSSDD